MTTSTTICCICLESLVREDESTVATVPCGHIYHECCLKRWAQERYKNDEEEDDDIGCPNCASKVTQLVRIYLNTKTGIEDSLSGKELESWRNEYDNETKSERLKLHADILESNKRTIDEIFQKQKIMETYENDRKVLDQTKSENQQLRQELYRQIMKYEAEMRRVESTKKVVTEVLERNEKALRELKEMREENLDLKRELLRNIMTHQKDMKKLESNKQALKVALVMQEEALLELRKSREENISLKRELVEHLQHHKVKMAQLQSHKDALNEIIEQHNKHKEELDNLKKENADLKEELVETLVIEKADKQRLERYEDWMCVFKEEAVEYERDRAELKVMRTENYRLGTLLQKSHKMLVQARGDVNKKIHETVTARVNGLLMVTQMSVLGFTIYSFKMT